MPIQRVYMSAHELIFTWWLEKTKTKAAPAAVRPQVKRVPNRAWIIGLYPSNMVPDLTKHTQMSPERK